MKEDVAHSGTEPQQTSNRKFLQIPLILHFFSFPCLLHCLLIWTLNYIAYTTLQMENSRP